MLVLMRMVVVAVSLLAPGLASAQAAVRITGYGEFSVARELGIREPQVVDGDPEPVKSVDGVRLIEQTGQIEGRLCRRFGIRFILDGMGTDGVMPIIVRTRHPAITRPGGVSSTGGRYASSIGGDQPGWVGFTFDYPWELVAGTWSFAIMSDETVLAEQRFVVTVPPDADQPPPGGCGAPVS